MSILKQLAIVASAALVGVVALTGPSTAQTLRVATNANASPFTFPDPATSMQQGFSIDLMNAIAMVAGFQVEYLPMGLNELIPALMSGQVDIIAANLSINEERAAQVDFTVGLVATGDVLVVAATDTGTYRTLADLAGEVIGVQRGTIYVDALLENGGDLREIRVTTGGRAGIVEMLATGQARAAVVTGAGYPYDINVRGLWPEIRIVPTWEPFFRTAMGFAVQKGNTELLDRLNTAIATLTANGTLDALRAKWSFGAPVN